MLILYTSHNIYEQNTCKSSSRIIHKQSQLIAYIIIFIFVVGVLKCSLEKNRQLEGLIKHFR